MLVSVIIPMYNRETTIEEAAKSVLNQTYKELELIIVDDCSTDNSVSVVERLSCEDARVRLIKSEKNGGACVARNIGIDNAKGQIIALHDSDDVWHEDKLSKSLDAMEVSRADFVFSALRRIGDTGRENNWGILPKYNMNNEKNKLESILSLNCVSTQTIVCKKSVFDSIKFDESLPRFQDWDLAIQVFKTGVKTYFIEEPLVDCVVSADSITSNPQKALTAIKILEKKYIGELKKHRLAYHRFYEKAAYIHEDAGVSGAECFLKAFKAKKRFILLIQYMFAKLRIYRKITKIKDKILVLVKK